MCDTTNSDLQAVALLLLEPFSAQPVTGLVPLTKQEHVSVYDRFEVVLSRGKFN